MAVELQSGLRITASTTFVTQACPVRMEAGGCSLSFPFGTTHETAGSIPVRAARKKFADDWMLESWPSWRTVVKSGSGFQMSGVEGCWGDGEQNMASLSQSGCVPGET